MIFVLSKKKNYDFLLVLYLLSWHHCVLVLLYWLHHSYVTLMLSEKRFFVDIKGMLSNIVHIAYTKLKWKIGSIFFWKNCQAWVARLFQLTLGPALNLRCVYILGNVGNLKKCGIDFKKCGGGILHVCCPQWQSSLSGGKGSLRL